MPGLMKALPSIVCTTVLSRKVGARGTRNFFPPHTPGIAKYGNNFEHLITAQPRYCNVYKLYYFDAFVQYYNLI